MITDKKELEYKKEIEHLKFSIAILEGHIKILLQEGNGMLKQFWRKLNANN